MYDNISRHLCSSTFAYPRQVRQEIRVDARPKAITPVFPYLFRALPVRRPFLVYRRAILPFFLIVITLRQKPYRAATARRELPVAALALAGYYRKDGRRA
jgi:hypothetical protein